MRSFTKLKVRTSLEGEKFTHWLPLYFGETEKYQVITENYDAEKDEHVKTTKDVNTLERFEKHLYNSIAYIANGNIHKGFTAENVLAIFPRLITTHISHLMTEARYTSIVAIRRLINFMRIFQFLKKKDPRISELIDAKLKDFIEDP
jgi:hypothetical protein